MVREENLRPDAERNPPVPAFLRITTLRPLVNEDRLNGEPVVWLKQQVLSDSEPLRILEKRSWVIDRRAEIAGGSLSVLYRKPVVAALPLQTLMGYPEGVSICCGNDSAGLCRAALRSGEIEPYAQFSARRFHVIETHINVALRVIAIFGSDVGTCA